MGMEANRARSSYSPEALRIHQRKVERLMDRYTKMMLRIEALLSRSKDCPLTIQIDAKDLPPSAFWTPEIQPCMERLVDLTIRSSPRWRNLYLELDISSKTSPLFRLIRLTSAQLPVLKSLRIAISMKSGHFTINVSNAILAGAGTAGIDSLTKVNASMSWGEVIHLPIQWSRLTHFSLLGDHYWERPPFTIHAAHELLKKCPNLVYCTLQITAEGDTEALVDTAESSMITLRHLETLNVHGIESSNRKGLASRLNLPRLHTLTTCFTRTKPAKLEESGLVEWANLYGEQLTTVTFEYNSITQDALVHVLSKLPNASHLTMIGQVKQLWLSYNLDEENTQPPALINEAVIRGLTPEVDLGTGRASSGECFCPNLERLECRLGEVEEDERGWVEMVAARREQDVDGMSQIKEVLLTFDCPQTLDMQEELRQRGSLVDDFSFRTFYQNDFLPDINSQFERHTADWFCD